MSNVNSVRNLEYWRSYIRELNTKRLKIASYLKNSRLSTLTSNHSYPGIKKLTGFRQLQYVENSVKANDARAYLLASVVTQRAITDLFEFQRKTRKIPNG